MEKGASPDPSTKNSRLLQALPALARRVCQVAVYFVMAGFFCFAGSKVLKRTPY